MLGQLPELDMIICQKLSPHDLAQCAQVSKKWHTIVMPYLWRDLSCLNNSSDTQRRAFRRLVLEDYLSKKRRQELQGGGYSIEQPIQVSSTFPLSTLEKYRSWIRILPGRHRGGLRLSTYSPQPQQQEPAEEINEPKNDELLLHLFRQCNTAKVSQFRVYCKDIQTDDISNAIAELILPRVHYLTVHDHHPGHRWRSSVLKSLLDQCSSTLDTLTLDFSYDREHLLGDGDGEGVDGEDQDASESTEWTSLKELRLRLCKGYVDDPPQPHEFWSWLYKRCGQVEKMIVIAYKRGNIPSIARNMLDYMPNLTEITVGNSDSHRYATLEAGDIATLLSGSSKGWKIVKLRGRSKWGNDLMRALEKHFSTLEAFYIDMRFDTVTSDLAPLLAYSPNLCILECNQSYHFKISSFIDQDPDTGLLKTWACEKTLKVLKIHLDDTLPPDSENAYAGDGQGLRDRVYDRIARLTSLETLSFCHKTRVFRIPTIERDCPDMLLESGLHKLSGLKSLKELDVELRGTKIGLKEVQWMTEHWPELRQLYGLDKEGYGKEAVEWLQVNHPKINLSRF